MEGSDKLKDLLDKFESEQENIMRKAAEKAQTFFLDSFQKKGWEDINFEEWAETKIENKVGSLLDRTGRMKNSIRITNVTQDSATISSDVEYSSYVNNGTSRMQARPFLQNSDKMAQEIISSVKDEINKILNS